MSEQQQAEVEKTCSSCAHWEPPSERTGFMTIVSEEADVLFGTCAAIVIGAGSDYLPGPGPVEVPLAATMDGSMYRADLHTRAEFGCVLWKAKN